MALTTIKDDKVIKIDSVKKKKLSPYAGLDSKIGAGYDSAKRAFGAGKDLATATKYLSNRGFTGNTAQKMLKYAGFGDETPVVKPTPEPETFPDIQSETVFDKGKDESELEKHMKTYGEQAEEQFYGQFLTNSEQAKKFGIKLPYETYEEFMEWRKKASQEDVDYLEKQQSIASELEASQAGKSAKDIEAAEAATIAGLSPGREGVMSAGAPMVISEFTQEMERRRNQIRLERQSAQLSRDRAKLELKRAQEAGDVDLAQAIQGQLASIEQNIRQIDTEALQAATAANEQSMKVMEVMSAKTATVSENLFNLGSVAASLTYDQLENMIVGTDMTMPQALAIQQAAVLQGKALETKNQAEADRLTAQAKDLLAKAGKTTGQLEYEFFKTLGEDERAAYVELKRANPNLQFYKMDDDSIVSVDPVTGEATVRFQGASSGVGSKGAWGTVSDALSVPDGTPIDPTTGEPAIDSWNGKKGSVQCGQFVNRYTGLTMSDDYNSKINAISGIAVDTPQAGDVFVSPYESGGENIGHAGFIVGVSADGKTVTVKDANYSNDGQIQTHEMSTKGMKFGRPGASGDSGLQKYLDVAKNEGVDVAEDMIETEIQDTKKRATMMEDFNAAIREKGAKIDVATKLKEDLSYLPEGLANAIIETLGPMYEPSIMEASKKKKDKEVLDIYTSPAVLDFLRPYKNDPMMIRRIYESSEKDGGYGLKITDEQLNIIINAL